MRAAVPLILGALAVGTALRAFSGTPLFQTDLAPVASGGSTADQGSPEAAVAAFYAAVGAGDYDRAWELSLEPRWAGAARAGFSDAVGTSPAADGWTAQQDFVSRCRDDIGDGLRLNGVQVQRTPDAPETAEAEVAAGLAGARLFSVHASGQMLGACVIYRWDRDLAVARIDGRYRVVLPGTKERKTFFHQAWFSNLTFVASLRATDK